MAGHNKLKSNNPSGGMPTSFQINTSKSLSTKDIRRHFTGQVGFDIETRSVDRFSRDILQLGFKTPKGGLFEINLQQKPGFSPQELQHFHHRSGGLVPYYSGQISNIPGLDLTKESRFQKAVDETGSKFFRSVMNESKAQAWLGRFIGSSSNVIGHNIINFEMRKLRTWMGSNSPLSMPDEYWNLIKDNKASRYQDVSDLKAGRISPEIARQKDRYRQMQIYEWMATSAKKGSSIIDTMELAKSLNAIAQERGLIHKGAELSLGTNVEFLASTILKGRKELHRASQDVALQNMLAPRLAFYVEELKAGRTPKGLQSWTEAWKNPVSLKVASQTKAIEKAIENIQSGVGEKIYSGNLLAKSYKEYTEAMTETGTFAPAFKTQGIRVADYGISHIDIFKQAESNISDHHKKILEALDPSRARILAGPKGMTLPAGLGKAALIGAGILGLGYIASKTFNISGKDDDYNSIEGLKHGWFGNQRKSNTSFGSGYNPDLLSQFTSSIKDPVYLAQVESEIQANQEAQQLGEFNDLDLMHIKDRLTLEALNLKRKQLREIKLAEYQISTDDADTLVLNKKGSSLPIQIRLAGIDAPEVTHANDPLGRYRFAQEQPYGQIASNKLAEVISSGRDLRLVVDPTQKTYGRYLGVLFQGNKNVNLKLVDEGYASSLEFGSIHKDAVDRATFMAAGGKAEREGLGIWKDDFYQDWRAFSAGYGKDVTFNSFTDILRLSKNKYLAEGAKLMWEEGASPEESYQYGTLYKATNSFSGKDGQYNTIGALPHRWFGNQRKANTDFGSGYKGPLTEREYAEPTPFNWSGLGLLAGAYGATKFLWSREANLFGKTFDISNLSYLGTDLDLGRSKATYGDLAYNAIRRFELGFGGFPKAFSISTLLSPSILRDAKFEVDIGKKALDLNPVKKSLDPRFGYGYKTYLQQLTGQDLKGIEKVQYKSGKLFGITGSGETKMLLEEARLFQRIHDPNITKSASQFAKSYEHIFNIAGTGAEHQYLIGGGKNKAQAALRVGHAFAHETLSKYLRLVDDPVKAFREVFPNVSTTLTSGVERFTRFFPKLGVGSEKELIGTVPQLLGRHAAKALPVLLGLPVLYGTVNWMAKQIAPEDSIVGRAGITGAFAETARLSHMTFAATSQALGLTGLRKDAEEKYPGMVGFKPWLGLTLSGALTGSTIGMTRNIFTEVAARSGKERYAEMLAAKTAEQSMPGFLSKIPTMKGTYSRAGRYAKAGALIGGTLGLPFLLMGLGSDKTISELDEEYLGGKEVPIRKARWWEFGQTPWEGERVMYYRPNWYNRLLSGSTEKSIYGDEDLSPIGKFAKTFADPYWLEKQHYYDRPYPITGSSGEDLGLFGPLYEWTIGRVMKPPAYMHTGDWQGGFKPDKRQYEPSKELGGLPAPEPISPYSVKEQIKQQYYSAYEAVGLRGFAASVIKEKLTGEQDLFEESPILQSAADIDSVRRNFWDFNLGGLLGLTEPYRRFVPKRSYSTEYVNPIENKMPEWMPGEDYFVNFKTGDPYAKVAEGEYRLPGKGYEARYSELEGLSPDQYPLIHKYKILADVAPYSKEFRKTRRELESYEATEYEKTIFEETEKQLEEKRKTKQFRSEVYDQTILGRYGSALVDIARANPLEQLTPLAPAHKLLPPTDSFQSYEESIYGKEFKLWQRPIDDFIKPFATTAANLVGIDRIPTHVQEAREIEKYFDELKYVKFKRLEDMAHARGSAQRAHYYRGESSQTLAGADVYSNEFRLMAALPKREKIYFQQFANAPLNERERILELVPETMKDMYIAQWDKQVLKDIQEGNLQLDESKQKEVEKEIFNRMTSVKAQRKAEAESLLTKENLPSNEWIGWRSDVDLEDIKLKYLIQTGRDYHYYDLWDDRLRSLRRKPYLEEAMSQVSPFSSPEPEQLSYEDVYRQAVEAGIQDPNISRYNSTYNSINYDLEYNRDQELHGHLKELGKVI